MEPQKQKVAVLVQKPDSVEVVHTNLSEDDFNLLLFSGTDTTIELNVEYFIPLFTYFISFYGTSPVTFLKGDTIVFKPDQYTVRSGNPEPHFRFVI